MEKLTMNDENVLKQEFFDTIRTETDLTKINVWLEEDGSVVITHIEHGDSSARISLQDLSENYSLSTRSPMFKPYDTDFLARGLMGKYQDTPKGTLCFFFQVAENPFSCASKQLIEVLV